MNSISSEKQPKVVIIQTDDVNIVKKRVHNCFGYINQELLGQSVGVLLKI